MPRTKTPAPTWWRYLELGAMAAMAPGFIFPTLALTPWLMVAVVVLWGLRWAVQGTPVRVTPLNGPLLLLLGMVAVSMAVTYDPVRSFPKVSGLFYGITLTFTLMSHLRTWRAQAGVAAGLLLAGMLITGVSLVGTRWSAGKVPTLAPLYQNAYPHLPALLRGIPRAEAGFNPNQVAGTLILFVPLAGALLGDHLRHPRLRLPWVGATLVCALVAVGAAGTILITQSRTGLVTLAVALPAICLTQGRRGWVAAGGLLLLEAGVVLVCGPRQVVTFLLAAPPATPVAEIHSWAARVEIWQRALEVIADHPLTGVGYDTLNPLLRTRYPTFVHGTDHIIWHAHNLYLEVALNVGIPGLIAYLATIFTGIWMQGEVWRRAPAARARTLASGLLVSLLAHLLWNMTDAITLGQKPGVLVWIILGLSAALWLQMPAGGAGGPGPRRAG